MDEGLCIFCNEPLGAKPSTSITAKGLATICAFSKLRGDGLDSKLKSMAVGKVHTQCRKEYTKRIIKSENVPPPPSPSTPKSERRKLSKHFNFKTNCVFCEAKIRPWTSGVSKIQPESSPDFDIKLEAAARSRQDNWAFKVLGRVQMAGQNLGGKGAVYHRACFARFHEPGCKLQRSTTPGRTPLGKVTSRGNATPCPARGRPIAVPKLESFEAMCKYIETHDDCQFSLKTLLEKFPGQEAYDERHLKRLLMKKYPTQLHFTSHSFSFYDNAQKVLNNEWYRSRRHSEKEERLRIVLMAADIIREDLATPVYDMSTYPSMDSIASGGAELIPQTLRSFVDSVVKTGKRGKDLAGIDRKCVALCQGLMALKRPKSFLSPLHLGLAVDLHRRYGSRSLIDTLNALGHCSSHAEVVRFGASVVTTSQPAVSDGAFVQFVMDNADFNIRTLTGHGTFHVMGAIMGVTPASGVSADSAIPRRGVSTRVRDREVHGSIPIQPFLRTSASGLATISVRDLRPGEAQREACRMFNNVDLLWLTGRVSVSTECPGWSGFMEVAAGDKTPVDTTAIVPMPIIRAPASNPSTIYTGLLFVVRYCRRRGQLACIITFDQPLFQKAIEMILQAGPNSELSVVVVRLGTFHLNMSFILAIGKIMAGSGIEELLSTVYAKNTVSHMLTGKAYSRAMRGLILAQAALHDVFFCGTASKSGVVKLFRDVLKGGREWSELTTAPEIQALQSEHHRTLEQLPGRTVALWRTFYNMVTLLKTSIAAERLGDWKMHLAVVQQMLPYFHSAGCLNYARSAHLYLQQMHDLESRMGPLEYDKYVNKGYFTLRQKKKAWSGNESDKMIEQNLMKDMKVVGGLTRGRGTSDATLANWIHTIPVCSKIRAAVEDFTGTSMTTSEQHTDLRDSRRALEYEHYLKFRTWFADHNPCSHPPNDLVALHSGLVADSSINCDNALAIGLSSLATITGQKFSDLKLSRSRCVRSLASMTRGVKVGNDIIAPVDVNQLFHRIVVLLQRSPETDLQEIFSHELAPRPASLFDESFMRVGQKSAMVPVIESFCPGDSSLPANRHFVIDGGYLLRVVLWPTLAVFSDILKSYTAFVATHYKDAVIVFDGYEGGPQTKDETHLRRGAKVAPDFVITPNNICSTSQQEFLANKTNKIRLIAALEEEFKSQGLTVKQAPADADTLIVETAISLGNASVIVGNDTDLLAILIGTSSIDSSAHLLVPGTGGKPYKVHHGKNILEALPDVAHLIPFVHAMTGCDTTSHMFRRSKKQAILKLRKTSNLRDTVGVFNDSRASHDEIAAAGELFILHMYSMDKVHSLNEARLILYNRYIAKQGVTKKFLIASLPPTSDAAMYHSFRTYHQVQAWRGVQKNPEEWGWHLQANTFRPITTTKPPAPQFLLQIVYCGCKGSCDNRNCECRRHGLKCSQMCGYCAGTGCSNADVEVEGDPADPDDPDDPDEPEPVAPEEQLGDDDDEPPGQEFDED